MPKWISVKDKLPDKHGDYLCFDGKYIRVYGFATNLSKFDKYDFHGIKRGGFYEWHPEGWYYEISGTTHWMPLPEPPTEGASE